MRTIEIICPMLLPEYGQRIFGKIRQPHANSRPSKARFAAFCCFPATDAWSCQALAPDLFPAAQAPNGLAGAALALPDG
jgi:hypothetical protein